MTIKRLRSRTQKHLFDHGGSNPAHLDLLKNLHQLGYHIEIYHIHCELNEALKRAQEREKKTHCHTPSQMIKQRCEMIAKLSAKYKKAADVFYTYDSTSNGFVLKDKESKIPQQNAA